jgi:hypothetical protein
LPDALDHHLPHRHRPERARLHLGPNVVQKRVHPNPVDDERHGAAGKDRAAFGTLHEMLAADVRTRVHGLLEPVVTSVAVATFV